MADKTPTPSTVDDYIAQQPPEARAMLEELRTIIKSVVPEVEEDISYQMPVFKCGGVVGWIGGFKKHCSLFGIHAKVMDSFGDDLAEFRKSKGTIQFQFGRPVPADLVRKLVKVQLQENDARRKSRRKKSAKS